MRLCSGILLLPLLAAQGKEGAPKVEPGKVAQRRARNGWTYALRIPKSYDGKRGARALLILHGSNLSGRAYLETVVSAGWFGDDLLLGPDGPNPGSAEGAHNFDEGSAKGAAEVFEEVSREWKVTKAFVGGHSQGGFLAWDVLMNHPDRFAGAFPMASGVWLRSEPESFGRDEGKARAQREVAIAVIHGRADPVVEFAQGLDAFRVFLRAGFARLRLFAPETLGHEFALSPLPQAVDWLETMTTEEASVALEAARAAAGEGRIGDAALLAARAERLTKEEGLRRQAKEVAAAAEKAAAEAAKKLAPRIAAARDDSWVAEFCAFRESCRGTKAAEPAFAAYDVLWKKQRARGQALFAEARAALQRKEEAKAKEACARIVAEAFASREYFWAKDQLEGEKKGR
ncbi:MAG: hypothetical protein ACREIU_03350 [Planctomycetota bacterium]